MKAEDARRLIDRALGQLEDQLEEGASDRLRDYLRVMSRFRAYSLGNALLIAAQRPESTRVAGYRTWQTLGRQVKRGEHGILILAPMTARRRVGINAGALNGDDGQAASPADAPDEVVVGFRPAHVFDISQTEGPDLPRFAQAQGDPREHLAQLKAAIIGRGIGLEYHKSLGGADGQSSEAGIAIRTGLTPAEEFSVLAHELAHWLMHSGDDRPGDHAVRETEAEAVAFAVCEAVGIQSRSASADYIHLHQGNKELLVKSLERIRRYAIEIIDVVRGQPEVAVQTRGGVDAVAAKIARERCRSWTAAHSTAGPCPYGDRGLSQGRLQSSSGPIAAIRNRTG